MAITAILCRAIACRIPEPLALAVWMAVADAVPLVGLIVGMVPAVLLAMTKSGTTAIIIAGGYLLYHQLGWIDSTMNGGVTTITAMAPGDLNGDQKGDVVWRGSNGALIDWGMNGGVIASVMDTASWARRFSSPG